MAEPRLDFSSLLNVNSALLPAIDITSGNANSISFSIASATTVTSTDLAWDGVFELPTIASVTLPALSGATRSASLVIQLGDSQSTLTFDRAVRIILP